VIYALGGGWGHLNRALALGRIAARRHAVTILTNSSYAEYVLERLDLTPQPSSLARKGDSGEVYLEAIAPDLSREETCDRVQQFLLNQQYDCLIVDTFPRGLGGELAEILPQLQVPRILVHRDLNPQYIQAKAIAEFVEAHFEQILIPGEGDQVPLAHLPQVQHTAPWLIRSADELMPPDQARSLLRLPQTLTPTVIVCASGSTPPSLVGKGAGGLGQEAQLFGTLTHQLHQSLPGVTVRCLSPQCPPYCPPELWVSHWPGIDYLQMADVVVGGAGYNTTYECAALGVPLISFAFQRLYDRQARRAQQHNYGVQTIDEAIALVRRLLQQTSKSTTPNQRNYVNGALQAVQLIESVICRQN
jgi:predicted glycosyltransferase